MAATLTRSWVADKGSSDHASKVPSQDFHFAAIFGFGPRHRRLPRRRRPLGVALATVTALTRLADANGEARLMLALGSASRRLLAASEAATVSAAQRAVSGRRELASGLAALPRKPKPELLCEHRGLD